MHVGLMVGTIRRKTLGATLDAIVEHDVHHLQYHVPAGLSLAELSLIHISEPTRPY